MRREAAWAASAALAALLLYWGLSVKRSSANRYDPNVAAFLAMLRHSEGTDLFGDPYTVFYGGSHFISTADHPALTGERTAVPGPSGPTDAAGAYQIVSPTWRSLGGKDYYGDFGPEAQDRAALDLIEGRGATAQMIAGDFAGAVAKLGREWASLPGSPYGQPTHDLAHLAQYYVSQGGTLTTDVIV